VKGKASQVFLCPEEKEEACKKKGRSEANAGLFLACNRGGSLSSVSLRGGKGAASQATSKKGRRKKGPPSLTSFTPKWFRGRVEGKPGGEGGKEG